MKIAFIAAMNEEFQAVARHLGVSDNSQVGTYKACRGTVSCHDVAVLESGMGFDNAAKAAEALICSDRPDIMISAGFCGGIASDLVVGDVVLATRLAVVSGNRVDEIPVELAAVSYKFVASQSVSANSIFGGLFVSTPVIMAKAVIASMLPTGTSHPVVEMESVAIARVAAKSGIPFVGIRSVSDPAGDELGFSIDEFCGDRMQISIPRVLLTIMRKPRIIPQLIRLERNSRIAGASLAKAVKQFLDFV